MGRAALLLFVIAGCATAPPEPLKNPPRQKRPVVIESPPRPSPQTPKPSLAEPIAADVDAVAGAIVFAAGGVGFTGKPLPELLATRKIAASADAIPALEWLAVNATPAGQLFAVWALHVIDAPRAGPHVDRLRADRHTTETMSGCIHGKMPVSKIADQIANGELPRLVR